MRNNVYRSKWWLKFNRTFQRTDVDSYFKPTRARAVVTFLEPEFARYHGHRRSFYGIRANVRKLFTSTQKHTGLLTEQLKLILIPQTSLSVRTKLLLLLSSSLLLRPFLPPEAKPRRWQKIEQADKHKPLNVTESAGPEGQLLTFVQTNNMKPDSKGKREKLSNWVQVTVMSKIIF